MRLICDGLSKSIAMIRPFAGRSAILPSELRNWHRLSLSAIRKVSPKPQCAGTAFRISGLSINAGVWLCPYFVIAAQQIQLGLHTTVSNLEGCVASGTNCILEVARAQHVSLGRFQLNLWRFGRHFPVCIDPGNDLVDQYGSSDWQFCVPEKFRCEASDFH